MIKKKMNFEDVFNRGISWEIKWYMAHNTLTEKDLEIITQSGKFEYYPLSKCVVSDDNDTSYFTYLILDSAGIHTVADLCHYTEKELLRMNGMCERGIKWIKNLLARWGLALKK